MANVPSPETGTPLEPLAYSLPQVSQLLNVSLRHVQHLVRIGVIPSLPLGKRRVVPIATFHEWLQKATVIPEDVA